MNSTRCVLSFFQAILLMTHTVSSNAGTVNDGGRMPSDLIGLWQVKTTIGGADASESQTYAPYGADDARLLGRFFSISSSAISADTPEKPACTVKKANTQRSTLRALTASLKGDVWVETMAADGMSSLGLSLLLPPGTPKDISVNFVQVACENGPFGKELGTAGGAQDAWMLLLPNRDLIVRWYDETVLVLERVPADAKPKPSFDCAKAATAPEKAICASLELASLDATIAERYSESIEDASDPSSRLTPPVAEIKKLQRDWLKQRNACGGDTECLRKSMEERLREEYRIVKNEGE